MCNRDAHNRGNSLVQLLSKILHLGLVACVDERGGAEGQPSDSAASLKGVRQTVVDEKVALFFVRFDAEAETVP